MAAESGSGFAVAQHRERLREQGLHRVELRASRQDAALLRSAASALLDPTRATAARSLLLTQFLPAPARSLKDLVASAPLDGVELERACDTGRAVEL